MTALPAPTPEERAKAREAAAALRAVIADPSIRGVCATTHVLLSNPRRGEWRETWANLSGFTRINGTRFTHTLLPGWEYSRDEIKTEMIGDLEALGRHGVRPTKATR